MNQTHVLRPYANVAAIAAFGILAACGDGSQEPAPLDFDVQFASISRALPSGCDAKSTVSPEGGTPEGITEFTITVVAATGGGAAPIIAKFPVAKIQEGPLTVEEVPPGDYFVVVETAGKGFAASSPKVKVEAGKRTKVKVLLTPVEVSICTTTQMRVPRMFHQATRLLDGRVLISGGFASFNEIGEEIKDVASGYCTAGKCKGVPVKLAATKVLEIYDPATGVFTQVGEMKIARGMHTATLLGDGKVLLAGGVDEAYFLPDLDVPADSDDAPTTRPAQPGNPFHFTSKTRAHDTGELFDAGTNQTIPVKGSMRTGRALHTAAGFGTNAVIVGGAMSAAGSKPDGVFTVDVYASGEFKAAVKSRLCTEMIRPVTALMTTSSGNIVAMYGGARDPRFFFATMDLAPPFAIKYPFTKEPTKKFDSEGDQDDCDGMELDDGKLEAITGKLDDPEALIAETQFRLNGYFMAGDKKKDNTTLAIFGGVFWEESKKRTLLDEESDSDAKSTRSIVISTASKSPKLTAGPKMGRRAYHSASVLPNDDIFLSGGVQDVAKGTFTNATKSEIAGGKEVSQVRQRWLHQSTTLTDGRVLVTGGWFSSDDAAAQPLSTAEIYTPAAKQILDAVTPAGTPAAPAAAPAGN